MLLIFGALFFVFVSSREQDENTSKLSKRTSKNETEIHTESKRGLQIFEISNRNVSDDNVSSSKSRSKRLDTNSILPNSTPESQKLILYPSRTLKPPRTQKMKAIHYNSLPPNHKISSRRILAPRVYQNHAPHVFLQPPSGPPYYAENFSPQRIFQNHNYSPTQMPSNAIQLKGTYRHARKNGDLSQFLANHHYKTEPSNVIPNFISPYEINQMISLNDRNKIVTTLAPQTEQNYFRRKFRQKVASIPNYNIHAKDAANIYGNVLQSTSPIQRHVTERTEVAQGEKPFSVMLDVYPMQGEENDKPQHKIRPLMSRYYQDPKYFNTMNFPQVMHRYPSYFHFQHQPQASSNSYEGIHSNGMTPSQIVVHLNLFPKNHKENEGEIGEIQKRVKDLRKNNAIKNQTVENSTPLNINFNINGHPENIMHQQYRVNASTSTEAAGISQNFFYDDEEDIAMDQSLNVAPSLVYKNIYRERPFHYEFLKNTSSPHSIASTLKHTNTVNLKPKYHHIDRSKKFQQQKTRKVFGPFY